MRYQRTKSNKEYFLRLAYQGGKGLIVKSSCTKIVVNVVLVQLTRQEAGLYFPDISSKQELNR